MTRKLYSFAGGECASESADNPMFHEVLLPGHLYQMLMKVNTYSREPDIKVIECYDENSNCIPRTKYVRGILWFSRRYAAASASADTSSFSR